MLDALGALPTTEPAAAAAATANDAAEQPKPGSWLDTCAFSAHGRNVPPALFLSRDLPLDFLQLRPESTAKSSGVHDEHEEERPKKRRAQRRCPNKKLLSSSTV